MQKFNFKEAQPFLALCRALPYETKIPWALLVHSVVLGKVTEAASGMTQIVRRPSWTPNSACLSMKAGVRQKRKLCVSLLHLLFRQRDIR